jgi:hypothetical protein
MVALFGVSAGLTVICTSQFKLFPARLWRVPKPGAAHMMTFGFARQAPFYVLFGMLSGMGSTRKETALAGYSPRNDAVVLSVVPWWRRRQLTFRRTTRRLNLHRHQRTGVRLRRSSTGDKPSVPGARIPGRRGVSTTGPPLLPVAGPDDRRAAGGLATRTLDGRRS